MCGRYTLIADAETLSIEFEVFDVSPFLSRRYNIAPTQNTSVVRVVDGRRQLATMRWSFVPSWADEPKPGPPLINARSETVATSPAFRAAFRRRRCIVPCSGFYEWKTLTGAIAANNEIAEPPPAANSAGGGNFRQGSLFGDPGGEFDETAHGKRESQSAGSPSPPSRRNSKRVPRSANPPSPRKQPYLIRPSGGGLLALAGIWESCETRGGEVLETFAILTTTPNRVMAELHNRMPVILERDAYGRWLDPSVEDPRSLSDLLVPCADERLELTAVSDRVNNAKNDDQACITPIGT